MVNYFGDVWKKSGLQKAQRKGYRKIGKAITAKAKPIKAKFEAKKISLSAKIKERFWM